MRYKSLNKRKSCRILDQFNVIPLFQRIVNDENMLTDEKATVAQTEMHENGGAYINEHRPMLSILVGLLYL